jgi:predicted enzyme related to lactoylglutathione lyase
MRAVRRQPRPGDRFVPSRFGSFDRSHSWGSVRPVNGEVVHFELPADDEERGRSFYRRTFGWRMESLPQSGYTLIRTSASAENGMPRTLGSINGGIARREAPLLAPVFTILVDDVRGTLKAIVKNGGHPVRRRRAIAGGMGFSAYFSDSEGNVVGLYQRPEP